MASGSLRFTLHTWRPSPAWASTHTPTANWPTAVSPLPNWPRPKSTPPANWPTAASPPNELPKPEQKPDAELRDGHGPDGELTDRHDSLGHTAATVGIASPGHVYPGHPDKRRLRPPLVSAPSPGAVGGGRSTAMRTRVSLRAHRTVALSALGHRHGRHHQRRRLSGMSPPNDDQPGPRRARQNQKTNESLARIAHRSGSDKRQDNHEREIPSRLPGRESRPA